MCKFCENDNLATPTLPYHLTLTPQALSSYEHHQQPFSTGFIMATICIEFYYNIAVVQYFPFSALWGILSSAQILNVLSPTVILVEEFLFSIFFFVFLFFYYACGCWNGVSYMLWLVFVGFGSFCIVVSLVVCVTRFIKC